MLCKEIREEALPLLAGSGMFGLGYSLFLTPGNVVLGGAGGVAITLRHFVPLPVGVWIFLLNLPLLAAAARIAGMRGMTRTVIGVLASSVATDLFALFPAATEDPLLGAAFGGALIGVGGGILLPRGFTTGGTDLAAWLWNQKNPRRKIGTLILYMDTSIVLGSAIILRNFVGVLHSGVAIAMFTVTLEAVMGGMERAKLSWIVSRHYERIGNAIMEQIHRGVTVIHGYGWYTGEERHVLLCVVKRSELYALKSLVRSIDADAFLIVTDAAEVLGEGFALKK